jgi:3-methyladenine DNA glycosylase AlkC
VAERLRDSYGPDVIDWVAAGLERVLPGFDAGAFRAQCRAGFDDLELMGRARRIADVMVAHLPADPHEAIPLVAAALGPVEPGLTGMTPFRYMPHGIVIAAIGLPAFEESMDAQYELTRRFTAEFSIRPFLVHDRDRTLDRLRQWATDPDENVRRLVSEGTRPRLPWAPRLAGFVADPTPVLALLELLRDDDSAYVRRSVGNNLNDISKDHPDLVVSVAQRWWADGSPARRQVVRQGLRTLVKRGDPAALAILGHGGAEDIALAGWSIEPADPVIGQRVRVRVDVADARAAGPRHRVAVDVVVHFVKANGAASARVFKGGVRELAPGESASITCSVSLAQHTTRTHYAGEHLVEAQVNGERRALGAFTLREA